MAVRACLIRLVVGVRILQFSAAGGSTAIKKPDDETVSTKFHTEHIGDDVCLVFEAPTIIDVSSTDELIASRYPLSLDGGTMLIAEAMTRVPNGNTASTDHVRANMHQRIYLSTSGGQTWTKRGEASPNCGLHAPFCNKVNISWSGPLLPCTGTRACGGVPFAHRTMFDLGKLQWASRYQGLGPTLRSEYIGLHHGPDSAGRIAQILRTPVEIRGLPPLTTFGCPRGVDQAPLRVSACNVARAGGKLLLPVAAFVNDSCSRPRKASDYATNHGTTSGI